MNKRLLEEINEVRSIMDLPILNEGTGFRLEAITKAVSVLDNLFGITTKTSDEIASKGLRALDGSMIKIGKESAVILKKLGDPNNTEPVLKLIDDIYKINPTVGKFVYTTFRNAIKKEAPNFIGDLDLVVRETKKLIDDNKIEEATEYFNTEIRMMNSSIPDITDDFVDNLIKLEIKLSKLDNAITFKPKPKPKAKADTDTEAAASPVNPKEIPNISKSFDEVVEQLSDEDAETLFKYASTKKWFQFSKRYLAKNMKMIRSSRTIQKETVDLIASLRKTTDAVKETAVMNKIIDNVQKLQMNEKLLYQELNYWVERYLSKSKDEDIKQIYKKLTKNEGWGKIIRMDGFFSKMLGGADFGFREYGRNFKDLRNAWLKVMASPLSLPLNAIVKVFFKKVPWFAKLSKNELSVFWKWFLSSSPTGWASIKPMYQKFGFPGAMSYVSSQVARRYISLKLISGILTAVGSISYKFSGSDNEFLKKYFSFDDYDVEKTGTENFFIKIFSKALDVQESFVLPIFVAAGLGNDLLNYLGTHKWEEAQEMVNTKVSEVEAKVNKEIEKTIYTKDNLPKFKKYMDEMLEGDSSQYGELGFDDTSFTFKFSGTGKIVKYTYKPLALTNKFEKITE